MGGTGRDGTVEDKLVGIRCGWYEKRCDRISIDPPPTGAGVVCVECSGE